MHALIRFVVPPLPRAVLAGLLLAWGMGAAAAAESGDSWRLVSAWDDGKAEFCSYEVDWRRYGTLYPGTALLIVVKEPWAPDYDVKANRAREDGFEVLKLNHVRDVPTGIYSYHQMASAFVRRDSGELRKLAVTSAEGCGISTAHLVEGRLDTRSYFDGQGDQSHPYPEGVLPEDALPMMLRELLSGELPARVETFPSLMTGRFPPLDPVAWTPERRQVRVEVPAGEFGAIELRLTRGNREMVFQFDERSPHRLLRWKKDDGTEYRLNKCERLAYWQMARPGAESWYPDGRGETR